MKKVLITTTALVMTAGVAAAEVSVGGSGRMGVIQDGDADLAFTSRIRISFSASGETDAGLSFGGSIRADNSGGGNSGTDGSVFIEGTFGKITMGDTAGAPEAAVGDLSGVGLTGLGDQNEFAYLSNSGDAASAIEGVADTAARQAARWDYTTGDLGVHVSANQIGSDADAYGIAVTYAAGNISFGVGYEDLSGAGGDADHVIAGVTAGLGDATLKAIYGTADIAGTDFDQYGLSVDYVTGATTLTAFYRNAELDGVDGSAYGVGVAYDLGGGASIKAGYTDGDDLGLIDDSGAVPVLNTAGFGTALSDGSFDLGISMSF